MKTLTEISRLMSYVLRHKPERLNMTVDEYGWAEVDVMIERINEIQPFNMELLEQIVREDEKQRYSFNEDKTLIRANQGHSIPVDVELEEVMPPEVLWHGTGKKYVESILQQGLIRKSRLYVHLSDNVDTAVSVGKRHGIPVLFRIDTQGMIQDGYHFYRSKNGVWLTKHVPREYLIVEQMSE